MRFEKFVKRKRDVNRDLLTTSLTYANVIQYLSIHVKLASTFKRVGKLNFHFYHIFNVTYFNKKKMS